MNKIITKFTSILVATTLIVLLAQTKVFASDITSQNITYLINKERVYYGLNPLKSNEDLDRAAALKSKDMLNRGYFDHYAFGLTPWDFITNAGYKYLYAGENLAMDFDTAEGMVNAWMVSPSHRANILNPDYQDMGVGVVKGVFDSKSQTHQTVMVTNMFGRKKPVIVDMFDKFVEGVLNFFRF